MRGQPSGDSKAVAAAPPYWRVGTDSSRALVVSYVPRGGKAIVAVAVLGVSCLAAAAAFASSIVGAGTTIAGWILVTIVSGSAAAFGLHCLQRVLYERHDYRLGSASVIASHRSLWRGTRSVEIPRADITHIAQQYSPPKRGAARSDPGSWVTFLGRKDSDFALAGMGTEAEARWLGPLFAQWAEVPLKRTHGAGFDEADAAELPSLDE